MPDVHDKIVSPQTGVSIGLAVLIVACALGLLKGQNDSKAETVQSKMEILNQLDKFDTRLKSVENTRTSWTSVDMFKWAVHLQQQNPNLKVPEPETHQ